MLTMPLEHAYNYVTCWNYYLIGLGNTLTLPTWWETSKTLNTNDANWRWIRTSSELPTQKENGKSWMIYKKPKKPGVEYYQLPTYELTESAKHNNQKQAGWAITKKAGKIAVPKNGDFGIVDTYGGNWLCEGASISYDGKFWIATCTYVWSGDAYGWDKDLYLEEDK